LVRGLASRAAGRVAEQYQAWLDPFQALDSVHQPPEDAPGAVPPAYGFAAVMALFAVLLNGYGLLRLRVWNPSGEPVQQREQPEDAGPGAAPADPETEAAHAGERRNIHAAPGPGPALAANPSLRP